MAIQTKEKKLTNSEEKDVAVSTSTFPGRQGVKIGARLSRILASFLKVVPKDILADEEKTFMDMELDFGQLADVLVMHLDEDKILKLILDLLVFTRVDGQEVSDGGVFDTVFAAEYGLLMKILKFVMEVNFTNFFDKKVIGQILSKIPKMPPMTLNPDKKNESDESLTP